MSLAGKGAVAIWHDIAPEGRAEFYRWHGMEHMPERAGIQGFLRGRRYIAIDGSHPEYFNLYETESPATLTGPDYLDAPEQPDAMDRRHSQAFPRRGALAVRGRGEPWRRRRRPDRHRALRGR